MVDRRQTGQLRCRLADQYRSGEFFLSRSTDDNALERLLQVVNRLEVCVEVVCISVQH